MPPWPIAVLGPNDLDFAVVNYDFTGLTAGELGPLPPLETAMDTALFDISTSITDQTGFFDTLETDLLDAASIPGEIDNFDFNQTASDLAKAATAGDQLFSDYSSLVGSTAPPPPACSGYPALFQTALHFAYAEQGFFDNVFCASVKVYCKGATINDGTPINPNTLHLTIDNRTVAPLCNVTQPFASAHVGDAPLDFPLTVINATGKNVTQIKATPSGTTGWTVIFPNGAPPQPLFPGATFQAVLRFTPPTS
jgi:hypothetical protein